MAPKLLRPEPLRAASGLEGIGNHHHAFSAPRHIAPTAPEQGADALRVTRLERLGVPRRITSVKVVENRWVFTAAS